MTQGTTWLFVPGSRPDRFAKACSAGADRVIFDLEDAVAPEDKGTALRNIVDFISTSDVAGLTVRVNALTTPWAQSEATALRDLASTGRLSAVMVAKAESAAALSELHTALGGAVDLIPLIESARGVAHAIQIAATKGVATLAIGGLDLAVDMEIAGDSATMSYLTAQIVLATRLAGKPGPIASPPTSIHDADAVELEARAAVANGCHGHLCIHPSQIAPITVAYRPNDDDIAWAKRVLASEGAAAQVDGHMVDKPVRDRAAGIMRRAGGER